MITLRERCTNVVRARLDRLTPRHMGRYDFVADTIVADIAGALAAALGAMTSGPVPNAALCAFLDNPRG